MLQLSLLFITLVTPSLAFQQGAASRCSSTSLFGVRSFIKNLVRPPQPYSVGPPTFDVLPPGNCQFTDDFTSVPLKAISKISRSVPYPYPTHTLPTQLTTLPTLALLAPFYSSLRSSPQ